MKTLMTGLLLFLLPASAHASRAECFTAIREYNRNANGGRFELIKYERLYLLYTHEGPKRTTAEFAAWDRTMRICVLSVENEFYWREGASAPHSCSVMNPIQMTLECSEHADTRKGEIISLGAKQ